MVTRLRIQPAISQRNDMQGLSSLRSLTLILWARAPRKMWISWLGGHEGRIEFSGPYLHPKAPEAEASFPKQAYCDICHPQSFR